MMSNENNFPSDAFWSTGQTFLIIAPPHVWANIMNKAITLWKVSKFDTSSLTRENMTIEEARNLRSEAGKKPLYGQTRLSVIEYMDLASPEIANTLLKVLEEPAAKTCIILFSQTTNLLPTVLSRCQIWRSTPTLTDDGLILPLDQALDFGTVSLRIAEIVKLGQTTQLIDQWSRQIMDGATPQTSVLHWLIESRLLANTSQINQQLFLEMAWLAWRHQVTLPNSIDKAQHKHGYI